MTMNRIIKTREFASLMTIIVMFLLVGLYNPSFLKLGNIFQTINGSAVYSLVAIGMCFVLFIGEIDVSVGATLGLSASVVGMMVIEGFSYSVIVVTTILIGIFIGVINAIGVVHLKIPSIIMTLGTNGIIRGSIYLLTDGKWIEGLSPEFKALSQLRMFGTVSYFYLATVILAFLIFIFMKNTLFGKSFKATGDNAEGAKLIGLPVKYTKIVAFILCSIGSSLAGVLYASRVGFITPTAGVGYEMSAIAACVIGGVSLAGGIGSIWGGLIGSLLMTSISRILVFIGLPSTFDNTITGMILIVIVVGTAYFNKRSYERIRVQRLASRIE